MSRYISEDILLEDLWDSKCESDILRRVRQAIVDEIIGIEGIDICFCKECKWCDDAGKKRALICANPYIDVDPNPNFFCGYGQKGDENYEISDKGEVRNIQNRDFHTEKEDE